MGKDFSSYKVFLVPVMQIIDEQLAGHLRKFEAEGGTIVFSFRAGIKVRDNNMYFGKIFPCNIRDFAGICIKETESLHSRQEAAIIVTSPMNAES